MDDTVVGITSQTTAHCGAWCSTFFFFFLKKKKKKKKNDLYPASKLSTRQLLLEQQAATQHGIITVH
jgi:hypothetical protein